MTDLAKATEGRWRGILQAIGMDAKYLTGRHGPCPFCQGKRSWRYSDYHGGGEWICTHCGNGNGFELVKRLCKVEFAAAAKLVEPLIGLAAIECRPARNEREMQRLHQQLWKSGQLLTERTPTAAYLSSRGITILPWAIRCGRDQMLGQVVGRGGQAVNVHRTILEDGKKLLMPGSLPAGSHIRLGPMGETLGIAEGIVTACAASQIHGMTVWAGINAGCMEGFQPPAKVKRLVIMGDNDASYTGQKSAYALAHKLAVSRKDLMIEVRIPDRQGDWADVLKER